MNRQCKRQQACNRHRTGGRGPRALGLIRAHWPRRRRAMSLLEVILAIAILAGTLAILGEIIRAGARAGRSTTQLSAAQLICESLMVEQTSGMVAPESTEGEQIDDNGDAWQYSIQVEQAGQEGLLSVTISVQEQLDQATDPVTFTLVRWMVDPQLESELEAAAAEADAAAESAASTSDDSGSAGTGSSAPSSSVPSSSAPSGGTGNSSTGGTQR